jgi:S-DNA-T family DNA segregation ATPase FtsK/SpoIIIE
MSKSDLKLSEVSPGRSRLIATFAFAFGILCLLALLDYNPESIHATPQSVENPVLGKAGVFTARTLLGWFGVSSWLIPWFFINLSLGLYCKTHTKAKIINSLSILLCCLSISIMANVRDHTEIMNDQFSMFDLNYMEHGAGGSIGAFFYSGLPFSESISVNFNEPGILKHWLGSVGTVLLAFILFVFGLYYQIRRYFSVDGTINRFRNLTNKAREKKNSEKSRKEEKNITGSNTVSSKENSTNKPSKWRFKWFGSKEEDLLFEDVSLGKNSSSEQSENPKKETPKKSTPESNKVEKATQEKPASLPDEMSQNTESDIQVEQVSLPENVNADSSSTDQEVEMDGFKVVRAAKTEKASDLFPERKGDYHFPTLELLMEPPDEESNEDEDHMIKARNLKETLAQFKVDIELGEVHTGPVITRYDVHPAAGVRVEKISNLDKNLAMALKADSVRILAPVPGKGCVGIEVPNQKPAPVCLKEILQSKAWADSGAEIPIVLGKEASGRALVADLTKMPHLLVAGSTGSGKTVCINAIIASLCYHSSPEDVRFIMVDPKIVEMKIYNDLPHMLIPVVTEPKKVPGALKWLLIEMERRYQIFSKVGVRNIAGFNAKILKDKEEKEKAQLLDAEMTAEERAALSSIQVPRDDDALEIPENKLPYIVCIIDELADLMMVAQADVETGIARLAQLARAAGIHLIIATQRPSVNVITGVIKANLPSRISFRVASYRDSQTILDGKGAEALIGKGDMLFIPPGSSTFVRAQGAFVSDDEINGIVDYLKVNGPPQIIEEVKEQIDSAGEDDVLGQGGDDSDEDPMIRKAIEIIRSTKRASTSNLQRKLSIGYNRAARIMDELEDRGLVGPDTPGQGREILMDL